MSFIITFILKSSFIIIENLKNVRGKASSMNTQNFQLNVKLLLWIYKTDKECTNQLKSQKVSSTVKEYLSNHHDTSSKLK